MICLRPLSLLRHVAQPALLFLVVSSAFAQTQQPVFPVLKFEPYEVASPLAMAEGDVNGDSVADTVYAAAGPVAGSTTVTTALHSSNQGTGASLATATTIASCTPNSMLLAELNNDKKLDLVVSCNEGSVAILQGSGDGTFQAAKSYAVAAASRMVAADFNGDGYLDIAVAMKSGNTNSTFAVLLNQAAAATSMDAPAVYGGATGNGWIMAGDIDGDGRPDISAGTAVVAGTALYTSDSKGVLHAYTSAKTTPGVIYSIADLDSDGKNDLVYTYLNGADYRTIGDQFPSRNSGNPISYLPIPTQADQINFVDLNRDGRPEILVTGDAVTVVFNDGTGNLSAGGSWVAPGRLHAIRRSSDFVDLVFATPRGFYTLHGDGFGSFDGLPAAGPADQPSFADINNDGIDDLLGADSQNKTWIYAPGRGNGQFSTARTNYSGYSSFLLLADFIGDSQVDVLELRNSGLLNGRRSVTYALWPPNSPNVFDVGSLPLNINDATAGVAGDFDKDGSQDFVVAAADSPTTSTLYLAKGNGVRGFVNPPTPIGSSTVDLSARPIAADLNSDGRLDIVRGQSAYLNRADGFVEVVLPATGTAYAVGDLNGDGLPDIVVDNAVYSGHGDGSFGALPIFTAPLPANASVSAASIADVDGDGHADLILFTFTDMATAVVARGDGHGNFAIDGNDYTFTNQPVAYALPVHLNNAAQKASSPPDYAASAGHIVVSLLNQSNPAPSAPKQLPTSLRVLVNNGVGFAPLQQVAFYASVNGLNPTGSVTFKLEDGSTVGTAQVTSLEAILYQSIATAGVHTVTATYSGDANNAPASATFSATVTKAAPTLSLTANGPVYAGRPFTLFASLYSALSPTGPIAFTSNGQSIGSVTPDTRPGISTASFKYSFPAIGTYTVAASYPGDASNLPAVAAPVTLNVIDGGDFTISVDKPTVTVKAGEVATWSFTITSLRNYSGVVTMSCETTRCGSIDLDVSPNLPARVNFSAQTAASTPSTPQPNLRLMPVGLSALLLAGATRRRWRNAGLRLYSVVLVSALLVGLSGLTACSSGKTSPATSTTPASTTYTFGVVGTDQSAQLSHSLTLTLVVTQ